MITHRMLYLACGYPYQYVSFNTFQYMAIEVLTPSGLPFGTLYDKTGTTGDVGSARTTELTELIKSLREALANKPATPLVTPTEDLLTFIPDAKAAAIAASTKVDDVTNLEKTGIPPTENLTVTYTVKAGQADLTAAETTAVQDAVKAKLNGLSAFATAFKGPIQTVIAQKK